ncbi:MAG: PAS domain-containing sensor histidine kinase [Thermodesulfobacteriota bacterium]
MHQSYPEDFSLATLLQDAWYKAAFESLPFPTLILDPYMVVREANQGFLERYRMKRQDVLGKPCYWVFHHYDQPCPQSQCRFQGALAGMKGCANLHHYRNEHGDPVWEQVHLSPLKAPSGRIIGVVESISDITQAKRLEQSLTETNEFLGRLLDSMVGVVVAADLAGNIQFVNKNVERVLGYAPAELIGQSLRKIAPEDDLRHVRQLLAETGGRALGVRTVVYTKDGEEVPVRINSSLVYRDGVPAGTVGIITDLRDYVKMEDSLVQARMQVVHSEKLARLGRMAAGIAHELNNPLTGITVYADLLKESLEPGHPAQADLSAILEDAERCRDIIRGLLDYSRQSPVVVEELDLSQVVEEALRLIRDDALFLHVEVAREYWPQPLIVQGDARLLRQVFINLITNAVDAMERRGRLTLRTYLDPEGYRVAEVGDTGSGIRPEDVARVFDPFFTTKEVGRGTGLGLSVVYGVISRHGGEIAVTETGPQGTTFRVRLPQEAAQELSDYARHYRPGAPPANQEIGT